MRLNKEGFKQQGSAYTALSVNNDASPRSTSQRGETFSVTLFYSHFFVQLTLITLFLFFQSAIFFLTLFLFHNSPTQDTYSYFSNYLWKSSTPAEPEKRVVVSYAFDKYDYKDFETRNCLIITYENGFHIWDIEDTKNIFEICSIKSEEKKKYFYSKILPTPFNEIKGQPKNIFSSMRPVLLSYDGEGFLSWTSLSTKHEESRKSHQKISGIDANRHVICIVSSSFFFFAN